MTELELQAKLEALGPLTDEQRNEIVCSLVGHSLIQTYCFGYYNCARCGEQMGDSLMGRYSKAEQTVIVGHDCGLCRANYAELGWEHKIFTPDPFPEGRPSK
ncbi:hypothetical protein D3C77_648020 [compost metagenome]